MNIVPNNTNENLIDVMKRCEGTLSRELQLLRQNNKPLLISIKGQVGMGKTTLARHLHLTANNVSLINVLESYSPRLCVKVDISSMIKNSNNAYVIDDIDLAQNYSTVLRRHVNSGGIVIAFIGADNNIPDVLNWGSWFSINLSGLSKLTNKVRIDF